MPQKQKMKFIETKLGGVYVIEARRFEDERGFFAPSFRASEFAARGIASVFVENNISYSKSSGTLRGIHYQTAPYGQDKLIRCTRWRFLM
jgi:dTDP-4-dehydrorhamnose 3,5-epimerase